MCRTTSFNSKDVEEKLEVLPANVQKDVLDYMESVPRFVVMKVTDWSYVVK